MISTLDDRVVLVGDFRSWTDKWVDLEDESNSDMTWSELQGDDKKRSGYMRDRIDLFSRIIDTSQFVIRCSRLRTQVTPYGNIGWGFGRKIDALVLQGKGLSDPNPKVDYKNFKNAVANNFEPSEECLALAKIECEEYNISEIDFEDILNIE